ncbi:MAG TPA: hypothetical protein VG722_00010 [Tepidisphaeraceae bacterium]|nr:hypothetical protein [Tepidisphaeraceae bacterium]
MKARKHRSQPNRVMDGQADNKESVFPVSWQSRAGRLETKWRHLDFGLKMRVRGFLANPKWLFAIAPLPVCHTDHIYFPRLETAAEKRVRRDAVADKQFQGREF